MGLRDAALAIAPPWLSDDSDDGVGGKLVYLTGLIPDALVDKWNQGVWARFPLGGTSGPSGGNEGPYADALTQIGRDRLIPQGVGETPRAYGVRLQQSFPTWQRAGTAQCVLQQVLSFLQTECRAAIVRAPVESAAVQPYAVEYAAGADHSLPPARWAPTAWLWDTGLEAAYSGTWLNAYPGNRADVEAPWWRDWLCLWPTGSNNWAQDAPAWGTPGLKWGDTDRSWGMACPASTIASIQSILASWKSAGTWYQWIVVSFDDRFANWGAGSAYYPTGGDWAHWSKVVSLPLENRRTYIAARFPGLRYCDGAT